MNYKFETETISQRETKHKFTRFESEDYSLPLMMAEYIDNSISSYEESLFERDFNKIDYKNLCISFLFNFKNKEERIEIEDNANGMTWETLRKAAIMYDNENKYEDDLNQHGIGMKAASFWLAKDFYLITKTMQSNDSFILSLKTSDKSDSDECKMRISPAPENSPYNIAEKGTKIILNNINKINDKKTYFENTDKLNFLKIFLGHKYTSYIRKGLKIEVKFQTNDEKSNLNFTILAFEIKPFNFKDFEKSIFSKNKDDKAVAEEKITNFRKDITKILSKSQEGLKNNDSQLENVCLKILNKKDVVDVVIEEFFSIGKTSTKVNIGIISPNEYKFRLYDFDNNEVDDDIAHVYGYNIKDLKKLCKYNNLQGLNFFHHHRGLLISPNISDASIASGKIPQNYTFAKNKKTIDADSTPIRLYGWTNVTNIKTEINKANLYISEDEEMEIRAKLEKIWRDNFKEILGAIVKYDTKEKSLSDKRIQNIQSRIEVKTNSSFEEQQHNWTINGKDFEYDWNFEYKYEKWNFKFIKDNTLDVPFDISELESPADNINSKLVKYSLNHSFWSPINNESTEKFTSFAFPIIVALVITEFNINENKLEDSILNPNKTEIIKVLNFLIKTWKSCSRNNNNDESEED